MFYVKSSYNYSMDELYGMLPFEYEILQAFIIEDAKRKRKEAAKRAGKVLYE
jgi:hypothetical protein